MAEVEGDVGSAPTTDRIRFVHQLAQQVPSWHPMSGRSKGREMQEGKDAGIVDLLLHANDIPFDVPSVYKMCEDAGMKFYRWLFPLIYNLESFFNDPILLNRVNKLKMSRRKQEEIAELAHGLNSKHSFIAVRPEFKPPGFSISNGKWRNLRAKLTPCMAWNRIYPIQGKTDTFAVPFTIVQDAWGPLEITRWQFVYLSHVRPELTLEEALLPLEVQKEMRSKTEDEINIVVEELLKKAMDRLAIVFI
jgi:hypothetical protein